MANHCSCCTPRCPSPSVEVGSRFANCLPPPNGAFYQPSTRFDGDGTVSPVNLYVVPLPERCQPFRQRVDEISGSFSETITINLGTQSQPNIVTSRETSVSGGAVITYDRQQPCPSCDYEHTASGSSDYSFREIRYGSVTDSDGEPTRFIRSERTRSAVYLSLIHI